MQHEDRRDQSQSLSQTHPQGHAPSSPLPESQSPRKGGAQAYAVWGMAMAGYIFAVTCRSSLSAIGIEAAEHFHTSSTALSLFLYLQLLVYALMQIPAGLLLDRYGSRKLIAGGGVLMAIGQMLMALAPVTSVAIVGRGIVGMGDAMVFISVIRLVSSWFGIRQIPLMNQVTSLLGCSGQLISLYPFVWLLKLTNWQIAFLSLVAVGMVIVAGVLMGVRDEPARSRRTRDDNRGDNRSAAAKRHQGGWSATLTRLKVTLRSPGTLCGFWVHGTTWFSINMMNQLWGVPFLLATESYTRSQASAYLAVGMLINAVWGIIIGNIAGIHPIHGRAVVIYGTVAAQMVCWTVFLLTPGPHPFWFMALMLVILTSGGPACNIAFDYARDTNDIANLGTATGFANTSGFLSSAIVFLAVGAVLDAQGATDPNLYTDHVMRVAMLVQYPLWIIGMIGFTVMLPKTLRVVHQRLGR